MNWTIKPISIVFLSFMGILWEKNVLVLENLLNYVPAGWESALSVYSKWICPIPPLCDIQIRYGLILWVYTICPLSRNLDDKNNNDSRRSHFEKRQYKKRQYGYGNKIVCHTFIVFESNFYIFLGQCVLHNHMLAGIQSQQRCPPIEVAQRILAAVEHHNNKQMHFNSMDLQRMKSMATSWKPLCHLITMTFKAIKNGSERKRSLEVEIQNGWYKWTTFNAFWDCCWKFIFRKTFVEISDFLLVFRLQFTSSAFF